MATPRQHVDAHFHFWDCTVMHDGDLLGPCAARFPICDEKVYNEQMKDAGVTIAKSVFVEAIAKDWIAEARWVQEVSDRNGGLPQAIVARVDLFALDAEEKLKHLVAPQCAKKSMRGIRQILNFEPSYPQVPKNFVADEQFEKGYALLEKYNLSFDLQVNPHQLKGAAALAAKYPKINVILNHLGMPKLGQDGVSDEEAIHEWREGMKALEAAGPHVAVKLSMLCSIDKDWDSGNSKVLDMVRETIELFGPSRCMFASNFPVDLCEGFSAKRLYDGFAKICEDLPEDAKNCLYSGTAAKFYRIE